MLNTVEAKQRALLADSSGPIARAAAGLHALTPAKKEEAFKRVVRQAIDAVLLLNESHGLRAVVYSLTPAADSLFVVDQNSRGKRFEAKPFPVGADKTAVVLAALAAGESRFVEDCENTPYPRGGKGWQYNTYISIPIASDSTSFGMLSVDAPKSGDLTTQDVNDIELLAGILSIAFAEMTGTLVPKRTRAKLPKPK